MDFPFHATSSEINRDGLGFTYNHLDVLKVVGRYAEKHCIKRLSMARILFVQLEEIFTVFYFIYRMILSFIY